MKKKMPSNKVLLKRHFYKLCHFLFKFHAFGCAQNTIFDLYLKCVALFRFVFSDNKRLKIFLKAKKCKKREQVAANVLVALELKYKKGFRVKRLVLNDCSKLMNW